MEQPAETLTFDQVELRRWRVSDVETLNRVATESLAHLLPWMPWAAGYDRNTIAEYLARSEGEWESDQAYNYAITSGGAVIGSCGLMRRIGPGGWRSVIGSTLSGQGGVSPPCPPRLSSARDSSCRRSIE